MLDCTALCEENIHGSPHFGSLLECLFFRRNDPQKSSWSSAAFATYILHSSHYDIASETTMMALWHPSIIDALLHT